VPEGAKGAFRARYRKLVDVRDESFSTELGRPRHFRFPSDSGRTADIAACLKSATTGLMHRSKRQSYSMTQSAIASRFGGISIASAFAVLRLITSWNLVGCSIGKSAGLAPFNILATRPRSERPLRSRVRTTLVRPPIPVHDFHKWRAHDRALLVCRQAVILRGPQQQRLIRVTSRAPHQSSMAGPSKTSLACSIGSPWGRSCSGSSDD
jgi:hypothetical protein